jgi:hypothetical protein
MNGWVTQKQHIKTHNLFHSAIFGEDGDGLVDIGFRIVGEFMYVPDTRNDVDVEPPYTLLSPDTAVFFDFITPGRITDEDIDRVSKYNEIGLEAVEEHLKRTPISEDHLDPNDIEWFDHCTVLREDQYIEHQSGSAEQREALRRLEDVSSLATVSPGTSLSLEARELRHDDLTELLEDGIHVPKRPPNVVYLTRDVWTESLAVGVCEEILLNEDLSDGGKALDYEDVRSHFGRDIPYEQLEDVFAYLRDIGACRKRREDGKFLFTKYKLSQIMGCRKRLQRESVEEHLYDGEDDSEDDLSELSDFM